jgi:hypothetical protein
MKSNDDIQYLDIHKLSYFVKKLQSRIIFTWRRLRVEIFSVFLTLYYILKHIRPVSGSVQKFTDPDPEGHYFFGGID